MPESSPYRQLRRVRRERQKLFRLKLSSGVEQTAEEVTHETWRRTVANLFPTLQGTPSDDRVLESIPYQHLGRVGREEQTLFRIEELAGVHSRTRSWV